MEFSLTISLNNQAFEDNAGSEVARIISDFANKIDGTNLRSGQSWNLRDYNGNLVGKVYVIEED